MSIYDIQVNGMDGRPVEWSAYRGAVLLIVNTASRCAYSRQFAGLQRLYDTYRDQGFTILGFPCNQFNDKEPDEGPAVRLYCEQTFGVAFPLFAKTEVRGPSAHPLFRYLTRQAPFRGFDPESPEERKMEWFLKEKYPDIYAGDGVKWNFSKFLIGRDGRVAGRYETTTEPDDIEPAIRSLLADRA
ncbi:glutathione peroxidase [Paenibacillus flagellatus]|uniref:Glutathione peroxidase n=1 Tax=Paenibacillus flagellatus TaxID=2211139 RepID=A0A2V5JZQ7_9BACL|nr:glutathione peroxidase [Paenibacillus flagellatus]PYI51792.1 glutathione peroxidase [Paenibacillus flagellatus]